MEIEGPPVCASGRSVNEHDGWTTRSRTKYACGLTREYEREAVPFIRQYSGADRVNVVLTETLDQEGAASATRWRVLNFGHRPIAAATGQEACTSRRLS